MPSGQEHTVVCNMFGLCSPLKSICVQATWFILDCWERISLSSTRKRLQRTCSRTDPKITQIAHTLSPTNCEGFVLFVLLTSAHCSSCGVDFNSVFMSYGDRWRLHRRFFHQTFRPEMVPRFLPYQHRRVCQFLRQLFDTPERLDNHVFE